MPLTRSILREQDHTSRDRNVRQELYRQLDMQFGIAAPETPLGLADAGALADWKNFGSIPLSEHGLIGTSADRFAAIVAVSFPFIGSKLQALETILACHTVNDLIARILDRV